MNNKKWTKQDMDFLEDKWGDGTFPIKRIAKCLNRSEEAVISKSKRMGLTSHLHNDYRITLSQLYKAINGGQSRGRWKLEKWIENGLPIKTHTVRNYGYKVIKIEDFWKWAESHQDLINLAKLEKNILGKEPKWVDEKRLKDLKSVNHHTLWSKKEEEILLHLVKSYKYNYSEIAKFFNRSESSIKAKLKRLNTPYLPLKNEEKMWNEEEIERLIFLKKQNLSFTEIGQELNRSSFSVTAKFDRISKKY